MLSNTNTALSNRHRNICEYGGIFGILISLTCLIQHIAVAIPSKITNPMLPGYIFAALAFSLLAFQKSYAVILLIISAAYSGFTEWRWMTAHSFSLVVLILFIYHVVIIINVYEENIPEMIKEKGLVEKAERDEWRGKI